MKVFFIIFILLTQLSFARYEFVKEFESFSPKRYWDFHRWSIGYGTKAGNKKIISKKEASKKFAAEIKKTEDLVKSKLIKNRIPYNDDMLRAITSFEYNLGYQSKMWKRLKKRDFKEYASAMVMYDNAGGKQLKGLTERRKTERELFLQGINKISKLKKTKDIILENSIFVKILDMLYHS